MPRRLAFVVLTAILCLTGLNAAQPDKVDAQKAAALANWKKTFEKGNPPHVETANFLVYGTVQGKELQMVADNLEKQFGLARKALDMEKEPAWTGKLAVYLFTDRDQFKMFLRRVERRLAAAEDVASLEIKGDTPHIAASPSKEKGDFGVDGLAGEQVAAALLTKKAGGSPPDWLADGFGRATVLQTLPKNELAIQRGKAKRELTAKKIPAKDVYNGNIRNADEAAVLRASLVEYLAYSGKTQVFPQFVNNLRPRGENMDQIPSVEDALKSVNVAPDQLSAKWQAWVKFSP